MKKTERVGEFNYPGRAWCPKGKPTKVNVFDYPHLGEGPAIFYGAYDVGRNEGYVSVGMTHETAVKISDEHMARLHLQHHHTDPDLSYTIAPRRS